MNGQLQRKVRKLDLDRALGRRLGELRRSSGIRQEDVAEALRVKRPLVSKIEGGSRGLNAVEIVDYAAALNMEPAALFQEIADIVLEYDGTNPEERQR